MLQRPTHLGPSLQGFLRRHPALWHRSAVALPDPTLVSHTFMNGDGLLTVSNQHVEAFYDALGTDLVQGHAAPLVERLSEPHFKYCCDVDIKETMLSAAELDLVGQMAHETLKAPCILLTPKVDAAADEPSAGGIHIVCPSLVVNRTQARTATTTLTRTLTQAMPHHPWAKWVDGSIYRPGGGLRLLGSSKTQPCTQCAPRSFGGSGCSACGGRRSVIIPHRRYWVWSLAPANPALLQRLQNIAWAVKYLSVRVAPSTEQSILPSLSPPLTLASSTPPLQRSACSSSRRQTQHTPTPQENVAVDALDALTQLLRKCHEAYEHITVASKRQISPTLMQVQVRGSGAHFCLNKGAAHHGNHIYFQISARFGLEQRCYSSKRPREGAPLCSMWRARLVHPLEPEVCLDIGLDPFEETCLPFSENAAPASMSYSMWPQKRAANQSVLG